MAAHASISALKPHFLFPLAGPQAQRHFVLGSVLMLAGFVVPILPTLFIFGYAIRLMRRTMGGEPPSMVEWSDWGNMLKDGLRVWMVWVAYFLPGAATMVLGFGVYFASMLGMGVATTAEAEDTALTVFFLGMGALFLSMVLAMLLLFLLSIPLPAAVAHVVAEGRLAAGFRFRQVWGVWRANAFGFLIAWLLVFGLGSVAYMVTMLASYTLILLCLMPLLLAPAYFYIALVGASLIGEVYAEGRARPAIGAEAGLA